MGGKGEEEVSYSTHQPPHDPPLDPGNALDDQVVTGESSRLVKTTHIHLPSKGYPEWFSAVYP